MFALLVKLVSADEQAPEVEAVESTEASNEAAASMEANNLVEEVPASVEATEL